MFGLKKKFRQVKKLPSWVYTPPAVMLRLLKKMMREEVSDPNNYINTLKPAITVTWHNRLLFFPLMFPSHIRKDALAVVSPSRDGQYITDFLERLGVKSARGSTSKRGGQVLVEAASALRNNSYVCFTPDGPRGPKYKMSRGPVHLASITGVPLVPVAINYSRYWQLGSWDNFQIPKPWSKLFLRIGDAIHVPPNLDDEALEQWRMKAEKALMDLTRDRAS
jgi:lysophospholipid acyltransferase (LPLAT)-like uncharacterized protein